MQRCESLVGGFIDGGFITDLDGMTEFLAVLTLHLRPILWLRAIAREVALFLTVAAGNVVWITGLITLLRDVIFRAAVTACSGWTSLNVGTLYDVSMSKLLQRHVKLTSLEK